MVRGIGVLGEVGPGEWPVSETGRAPGRVVGIGRPERPAWGEYAGNARCDR